jgi:hypothetical protein
VPFNLPKFQFVSELFNHLRKMRADFIEPRLFDLLFVALIVFSFGVALCAIGATLSDWVKKVAFCCGFALIVLAALLVVGVYLLFLYEGKAATPAEVHTESGLRKAKASHMEAKRIAARARKASRLPKKNKLSFPPQDSLPAT